MKSTLLSDQELRRYENQILLPEIGFEGQQKIKNSCIGVIGAGGLGVPVLQYLSASGVGKIGIIDFDSIAEKNIQRQVLYGANDVGKLKTICAKQHLEQIFKYTSYEIINLKLDSQNATTILNNFEFIVDATNNPLVNTMIDDACVKTGKKYILGLLSGMHAIITAFSSTGGDRYRNLEWLFKNMQYFQKNGTQPGMAACYGITGNFMALETLRMISGAADSIIQGNALVLDFLHYKFSTVSLKKVFVNNL